MNPNIDEQHSLHNNLPGEFPGDFAFSNTVLPGSKLEINQASNQPAYSTFLENRLSNLRQQVNAVTPKTELQKQAETVQQINLPKTETATLFTPPADSIQPPVQTSSDTLFSLPIPSEPLGKIAPALSESIPKIDPLFKQPLELTAPKTIPNIPPASFNLVSNLNQFQAPIPAPAQNIKPVIQNNIVPEPNNIAPQTISKPTQEVQTPEITIDDLKGIHLQKLKNGALNNAVKFQRMLSNARSV